MLGALIPVYYITFIADFKKILKEVINNNKLYYFSAFFLIQVLSIIFSLDSRFFNIERFFAISHNLVAYSGMFFGYYMITNDQYRLLVKKHIPRLFYSLVGLVFISTIYSFLMRSDLEYGGIFSFLGESKFSLVQYNQLDWYFVSGFPRTTILGIYPNSSAIVFLLVHIVNLVLNYKDISFKNGIILHLLLMFVVFMTGSRFYLVISFVLLIIYLVQTKNKLYYLILGLPIVLGVFYFLMQSLMGLRTGSNETRSLIYEQSLYIMIKENIFFGLGIKPKIPLETGFPYPLGSHSTLIGYFVKTGLVGGTYIFLGYLWAVIQYIHQLYRFIIGIEFSFILFYKWTAFMLILLASLSEDFDAFELIPFYFGSLLALIFIDEKE